MSACGAVLSVRSACNVNEKAFSLCVDKRVVGDKSCVKSVLHGEDSAAEGDVIVRDIDEAASDPSGARSGGNVAVAWNSAEAAVATRGKLDSLSELTLEFHTKFVGGSFSTRNFLAANVAEVFQSGVERVVLDAISI